MTIINSAVTIVAILGLTLYAAMLLASRIAAVQGSSRSKSRD